MSTPGAPRILIVDDEVSITGLLKETIQGLGYSIAGIAHSGQEAVQKAGDTKPDLILMDILLGGDTDGVAAAEQIRSLFNIPVIYVTGYADGSTLQRAKISRPYGYIVKPFKEAELHAAIEVALFRHRTEEKAEKGPVTINGGWPVDALKSMVDPVMATDDRGHIIFMNNTAEKLTGWDLTEARGQALTEIFEVKKEVAGALMDSSVTRSFRDQAVLVCRDKSTVPIDYSVGMIRDDTGRSNGFVVTFRNIAERRRVDESLRESRKKYKELVNSIEGIVWEADGDSHQFSFVSKQAQRLLGYPASRWLNEPGFWQDHIDPNDREWALSYSRRSVARRKDYMLEYRMIDNKGYVVWVRDIVNVVIEEGQSVRIRGVMLDITKLKHAEEALRRAHDELEKRVKERTAELSEAVAKLKEQIAERERVEAALSVSEQKYRTLIEGMSEGLIQVDKQDVIQFVNDRFCEMLGYSREEVLGQVFSELLLWLTGRTVIREGSPFRMHGIWEELEIQLRKKSGDSVWVRMSANPMMDSKGEVIGSIGILMDVTVRKQAEEALRESEERYALAARGANDGLWDWNLKTNDVYYSPRWKSMVGFEETEIGNTSEEWFKRVHPDDLDRVKAGIATHLEGLTPHFENEHRMQHRDGSYRWMLTRGLAVRSSNARPYRMAGSQTDITERKIAEEQLLHDAFHDALTNLSNRALFMDRLAGAVARAKRREDYFFAVLFLDMDRFKVVNDSLGHVRGDELLMAVSRRLEQCLRPGDTVARLGGDEFAILLEDISDITDSIRVAERIQRDLQQAFNLGGHEVFATASIGISPGSAHYERADDVLRDADTAMYRAKALGKARHQVFDKTMHARAVALLQLETDLRRAIERNEFKLYYQPIISFVDGRLLGFEALIRWYHPERQIVLPAEFISVAEETGLIIPIGRWAIREACRQLKEWQEKFPMDPQLSVSVNLSGKQLSKGDLIEEIKEVLTDTGLDPSCLKLEITESVIMENAEFAVEMLLQLRALNVQLNVDDFGTGYSSLSYLHRFPVNTLKIDQSFVSRIGRAEENSEIISTILTLARNLGMDVIAEGVETEQQLKRLKELGCNMGQGYYISVPLPQEASLSLLETGEYNDMIPSPTPKKGRKRSERHGNEPAVSPRE